MTVFGQYAKMLSVRNILGGEDVSDCTLAGLTAYLTACREWEAPDVLVVGHAAPDGDAVMSAVFEAFRRYLTAGVRAVPVAEWDSPPREVAWLLGDVTALLPDGGWLTRYSQTPLVLTDHFEDSRWPERVAAVVDHHQPGDADFTGIDTTIEKVGATTTLVTRAMRRDGLVPDAAVARMLLGAILLDTDGLSPTKTYAQDVEEATWLTALCGENAIALYDSLRDQLLSESDPAVLFARDYRLYVDRRGAPLLGFAILKVWDTDLPDMTAVEALLAADLAATGCRACVAKISAYGREGTLSEHYLCAGDPAAVATVTETVLSAGGDKAQRLSAEQVFLPTDAIHRGRKWLANRLLESLEK